jgi:F-type H+-transporting ATPase subunit epsilon
MADGVFQIEVVTPEASLLDAAARSVVLRSSDGDLTVLDGHTPLITDVVPCEVRVEPDEGERVRLAVHGGYLQVETGTPADAEGDAAASSDRSTRVTLLAGVAELADEIDVARAEQAKAAAEARLAESPSAGARSGSGGEGAEHTERSDELERAAAHAALRRAEVRLQVAGAPS